MFATYYMSYIVETNFLNVKEVSSLLNLSALTIYRYISEKKLKAIQFGGRYLIDKLSLDKFIQEKESNKTP